MEQKRQALNKYINEVFQKNKPTQQTVNKIEETFQCFKNILLKSNSFQMKYKLKLQQQGFKGYEILKYGSTINSSFKADASDLDLTIVIDNFQINHFSLLEDAKQVIRVKDNEKRYQIEPFMPRNDSSGSILQLKDKINDVKIDLMVNKTSEVLNSNLIFEYSRIDNRLLKLIYVLKQWNLNSDNKQNKFNQFSIVLMLIAFMQSQKMIPNLQARSETFYKLMLNQMVLIQKNENDKNGQQKDEKRGQKKEQEYELFLDVFNVYFETFEDLFQLFEKVGLIQDDEKVVLDDFCPFDYANLNLQENNSNQEPQRYICTPADILIQFFEFYCQKMKDQNKNDDIYAVDIQQSCILKTSRSNKQSVLDTFYAGQPFQKKQQIVENIKNDFLYKKYLQYLKIEKNKSDQKIMYCIKNKEQKVVEHEQIDSASKSQQDLNYAKLIKVYNQRFQEKHLKDRAIFIVDPFNKTYNPAKSIFKKLKIFNVWQESLNKLQQDKCDFSSIKLF